LNRNLFLVLSLVSVLLAACGKAVAAKSLGNPTEGEAIFNQAMIHEAPGCITCHSVEPNKVLIGPSLAGVATRAGQRVPGKSAVDYLRECIINPNAYVVEGFSTGVMYQSFGEVLDEGEINNLIAYLLTLE